MNKRPGLTRMEYDNSSFSGNHFKVSSPDDRFFHTVERKNPILKFFILLFLLFLIIFLSNLLVNCFVFVHKITVPIKGMSEDLDGYTILQISDLKGKRFGSQQGMFSFALNGKTYDAVVFTGDVCSDDGNSDAFLMLIQQLKSLNPNAPVYFIAGDSDPDIVSADYASSGSPFSSWVADAQKLGAILLDSPLRIAQGNQSLWLATFSQLSLDLDSMEAQYRKAYDRAAAINNQPGLELASYQIQLINNNRKARKALADDDILISVTHSPPTQADMQAFSASTLISRIRLILSGHYLGGLVRLPFIGPVFVPDSSSDSYGLFPGANVYGNLSKIGSVSVYNSSGLGDSDKLYPSFFLRFCNPPSVTLITLTISKL